MNPFSRGGLLWILRDMVTFPPHAVTFPRYQVNFMRSNHQKMQFGVICQLAFSLRSWVLQQILPNEVYLRVLLVSRMQVFSLYVHHQSGTFDFDNTPSIQDILFQLLCSTDSSSLGFNIVQPPIAFVECDDWVSL